MAVDQSNPVVRQDLAQAVQLIRRSLETIEDRNHERLAEALSLCETAWQNWGRANRRVMSTWLRCACNRLAEILEGMGRETI